MNDLKLLENELVPVYITDKGEKVVNGRELHSVLQSRQDFSTWVKKRLSECDAEENKDYCTAPQIYGTANNGHSTRTEYIIQLDTAKEMAMLERNEVGKRVRKYFIEIDNRYKKQQIAFSELSPELQMFNQIFQSVAQQQIEQKRLAKEVEEVKQTQIAIADTFQKADDAEDFQKWANNCIARIAESPKFDKGFGRNKNYSLARAESYERLKQKRNCRLDDRVEKAVGRALKERPDIKKSELKSINKIYIIANDKDLRPAYELVLKEMMVYYCVNAD